MYELWITDDNGNLNTYSFETVKEAYLYYLDNFATTDDFEYYKNCCGRDLRENVDDIHLIACMFDNLFNERHFIYKVEKNSVGTDIRVKIFDRK